MSLAENDETMGRHRDRFVHSNLLSVKVRAAINLDSASVLRVLPKPIVQKLSTHKNRSQKCIEYPGRLSSSP